MNLDDLTKNAAYVNAKNKYGDTTQAVIHKEGFIAGAEWERQRDKWISDKDELPSRKAFSYSQLVLCLSDRGNISIGYFNFKTNEWDHKNTVAWQPIPEPPKPQQP